MLITQCREETGRGWQWHLGGMAVRANWEQVKAGKVSKHHSVTGERNLATWEGWRLGHRLRCDRVWRKTAWLRCADTGPHNGKDGGRAWRLLLVWRSLS